MLCIHYIIIPLNIQAEKTKSAAADPSTCGSRPLSVQLLIHFFDIPSDAQVNYRPYNQERGNKDRREQRDRLPCEGHPAVDQV